MDFVTCPVQLRTGGGLPHEPFDEGSAWIFCAQSNRGPRNLGAERFDERSARIFCGVNPGTPQNELIASMSLWTTGSPPGAMTILPRGARRHLSCSSWILPNPRNNSSFAGPWFVQEQNIKKEIIGKTKRLIEACCCLQSPLSQPSRTRCQNVPSLQQTHCTSTSPCGPK